MDYNLFKEAILEALKERFDEDNTIEYREILKNNGVKLDGIIVRNKNSSISPTVYVNECYERFVAGDELKDIVDYIERIIRENTITDDFDPDNVMLFDKIKDRIVFKLINFDMNKDLLETIPYRKYLDLAIVYYISVSEELFECASILINNAHMKMWNKTVEEVDELAFKNAPLIMKPELKSMAQTMKEIMSKRELDEEDDFDDNCMFVLSNEKKLFGASAILYKDIIEDFSERLMSDIYILPSSVHEVIMIPSKCVDSVSGLDDMVCEVNATAVPKVDILSNHAYKYSRAEKSIVF